MIRRLLQRWFDRPDPAWSATGIRVTHTGYDEGKAVAGRLRALSREAARRRLEDGIGRRGEIREWRREA